MEGLACQDLLRRRIASHPPEWPNSADGTFRQTGGFAAGRLVMDSGKKMGF